MSSLSLQQQLKIQQKLSPAQIQVIRMLEVPGCELSQRVNEELQENPALEEDILGATPTQEDGTQEEDLKGGTDEEFRNPLQNDDFNYDNYIEDDETPDYRLRTPGGTANEETQEIPVAAGVSFGEYLKSQIYLTKMNKPDRHIAKFIVGNIDEDGYLRCNAQDLADNLFFSESLNVPVEKIQEIIHEIQRFDPPGVGAKDLQECLILQLKQTTPSAAINNAIAIITHHFEDLHKHRVDKICQHLSLTEGEYKDALQEITRLNPKPGNAWLGTLYERNQTVVIPDFIVEEHDGELIVQLNQDNIPELRISPKYSQMLADYKGNAKNQTSKNKETINFIQQKIDSARWFIDAIQQRNDTLLRTMKAIVLMQREFFIEGEDCFLKPLVLQDIADITGYDSSTISRVSNSKYVQTNFGIFPLKHFFSEKMSTKSGTEVSTRAIKQVLLELIQEEDKRNPYTDEQLVTLMEEKGYTIARRTVAKYRDENNILSARMRRSI